MLGYAQTANAVLEVFECFLSTELPYNDYFEYFGPDFKLHISPSNMTNQNTNDYLEKIKWAPLPLCSVFLSLSHYSKKLH